MVLGATSASVGVFGAATWFGCSIYDTSLLLPGADAAAGDVATGAGERDAKDSVDMCSHAFPPPRPKVNDPSEAGDIEIVNAVRTVTVTAAPDGGPLPVIGFDLDGVCTCPGPESCTAPVSGAQHCDDTGGRDNSGGHLVAQLSEVSNGILNQQAINQNIDPGLGYSLIFRVRDYNGAPNDTQVELAIFTSDGTPQNDAGQFSQPNWDGSDSWTIDSNSVLGGVNDAGDIIPNYVDSNAYVADGVLVSTLSFPIELGAGIRGWSDDAESLRRGRSRHPSSRRGTPTASTRVS